MKKIMFNDKYGLTKAVIEGWKTMTRRIANPISENIDKLIFGKLRDGENPYNGGVVYFLDGRIYKPAFKVGEVVAVAQSYKDVMEARGESGVSRLVAKAGYKNKMFVRADLMPHQIRITNVRVERMHDLSDEDCIREGIEEDSPYYWVPVNMSLPNWRKIAEGVSDMYPNDRDGKVYPHFWDSPRKAFAALIDRISGNGTWESNPFVFVYEFELVK